MSDIFCCSSIQPYRPRRLDHEAKFETFLGWAKSDNSPTASNGPAATNDTPPYIVQLVRQVNFGPLESKRYFAPVNKQQGPFMELTEGDVIQKNFQKLNSFKNFKCTSHNRFFEINLYQEDPVNKHHWRADVARPASGIDL